MSELDVNYCSSVGCSDESKWSGPMSPSLHLRRRRDLELREGAQ